MDPAWHNAPGGALVDKSAVNDNRASVAVIITAFNHARFLADALTSVRTQTRPADEIVVVDDGSTDNPAEVVALFSNVKIIRQQNRGPSAARNTGVRNCKSKYLVFLDADDRLLPAALEAGLARITAEPECAFVYGGHRLISVSGQPIGPDCFNPIIGDPYLELLRGNPIIMHATLLYRRDCLLAINGFDEKHRRAEDYEVYLRLAQRYPIGSHPETVAEYRRHGNNVSDAYFKMLDGVLSVLDRHEALISPDAPTRKALRDGRTNRRRYYVTEAIKATRSRWQQHHDIGRFISDHVEAARWAPLITLRLLIGGVGRLASKVLPRTVVSWMERIRGRPYS